MTRPLEMKANLQVLEHLGMNLYSNVPAVLAEIVANAWDADAQNVRITLDRDSEEITIEDDGIGMSRDDVIDHFLEVGFRRREVMGLKTARMGRQPMGRKGIGKLSSFSIANTVSVLTVKDDERTAFRMDAGKMKAHMTSQETRPYVPEELPVDSEQHPDSGTRIILTGLKSRITAQTDNGLRQRISRRFSVIGRDHNFRVHVNGTEITPGDRGICRHIEFIWAYGSQSFDRSVWKSLSKGMPVDRTNEIDQASNQAGIQIRGWIGTAKRPENLKGEGGESLNKISIFFRGKLAQEDILGSFGEQQIYADYVVGELHCDELDRDDGEDIATSSRQELRADDPRFVSLQKVVRQELKHVASCWSNLRRKEGARVLTEGVPEVRLWLEGLDEGVRKKADKWIGRLNTLRTGKEMERKELLKASILAFESYRRKEQLDFLEGMSDMDVEPVLGVFDDIDDLQLSYYGQIVKLRLGIIETLEDKLKGDQKERLIQQHVFDHLWLLDPSWDRVKGTERMEARLNTFLVESTGKLSEEERRARIDIGYRTSTGKHIIIEMKRGSVATPIDQLTRQIRTYRSGAKKLMEEGEFGGWPLEIVCLVGKPPPEWENGVGQNDVNLSLAAVNARLVFYDQLLSNAREAYGEYLETHKEVDPLWKIFEGIENFGKS